MSVHLRVESEREREGGREDITYATGSSTIIISMVA